MNILYLGKYRKRFTPVIEQIKDLPRHSKILELCFGDTYIAEYCKKSGYSWKGIDLNKHFVSRAQKLGYDAYIEDLASVETLPKSDVCIMMGSLYHFHPHTFSILSKMFKASDVVVISEPVSNLSNNNGPIGFFAKRAANTGKGNEKFRYDPTSLMSILNENSTALNYHLDLANRHGKDLIIKLIKNGKN